MLSIVTGATKGIGRAIAELLAEKGFDVAVCARSEQDLTDMQQYWTTHFPASKLYTQQVDMSRKDEVEQFGHQILEQCGVPTILVNNAGVYLGGQVLTEAAGTLEKMIDTNLYSAYYLTRILAPKMAENRTGHIFNLCSVASLFAYPNGGSYSISKFALLGFSKVLREELKTSGVKVTSVMPGATWSDSWKGVDLPESRLMPARDIALAIWGAFNLSETTVVEELLIRPQLGDL